MSSDLTTFLGGLTLSSPIIVGACPLTANKQTRLALQSAGAGAIVLPPIFEERILRWNQLRAEPPRIRRRRPDDAEAYLECVRMASRDSTIPVLASINGSHVQSWCDFVVELEAAGADAIELDLQHQGIHDPSDDVVAIERLIVESISNITRTVTVPVFAKLGRTHPNPGQTARQMSSGIAGMVLFSSQPDLNICLDTFRLESRWHISSRQAFVSSINAIFQVHSTCPTIPIMASGGVSSSEDVIKALLSGADAVMTTTAVCRGGPDTIRGLIDGLRTFMDRKHLRNLEELYQQRPTALTKTQQREHYLAAMAERFNGLREQLNQDSSVSPMGDRFGHLSHSPIDQPIAIVD